MAHIGVVLDVTILADTLDGQIGTLDTLVELCVGIVGGVHLSVSSLSAVVPQTLLIAYAVGIRWCVTPFYIAVNTVVGQETATV